jgi:protein-tyrosine phosphatase
VTVRYNNRMIDLHCHILPGVDDGPVSLDEALAMARFCVRDGVTHITATPHCNRSLRLLRPDILPHVARFNESLQEAGLPLVVLPGAEIQVADSAEYRRDFEAGVYCHLGDGPDYTLLEFSWDGRRYPQDAAELIGWLRERDMRPIVAHPERHGFFRDDPPRLRALVEAGAWLQVTVDSLLGNHGPAPRAASEQMVGEYAEVVLASDAHNTRRCSGLSVGYRWVRDRFGEAREQELRARAERVLAQLTNPQAAG